jgi:hypothetical protein
MADEQTAALRRGRITARRIIGWLSILVIGQAIAMAFILVGPKRNLFLEACAYRQPPRFIQVWTDEAAMRRSMEDEIRPDRIKRGLAAQ